jgi:hypothetical protein
MSTLQFVTPPVQQDSLLMEQKITNAACAIRYVWHAWATLKIVLKPMAVKQELTFITTQIVVWRSALITITLIPV